MCWGHNPTAIEHFRVELDAAADLHGAAATGLACTLGESCGVTVPSTPPTQDRRRSWRMEVITQQLLQNTGERSGKLACRVNVETLKLNSQR